MLRGVQSAQSKAWGVGVSWVFLVSGGGEITPGQVRGWRAWAAVVGHAGRGI